MGGKCRQMKLKYELSPINLQAAEDKVLELIGLPADQIATANVPCGECKGE